MSNDFVRLPLHDGFYLDTRKKNERNVIIQEWILKNGAEIHSLRFEIADKNDLVLVANYFNHNFTDNNVLRKSLDASFEDMEQFSYDRAAQALEKPVTWLIFEDEKLVAAALQTYYTPDEYYKLFNGELFHSNPKFVIKDDYAEDIQAKPYNSNASRIAVLSDVCISQIGKFLPKDVKNLGFGIAMGVHPKFMRSGLNEKLRYEMSRQWKDFNCNYYFGIATATGSHKLLEKSGVKELFCLPFKNYKEIGSPVFKNIDDEAKGCYALLVDIKSIKKRPEENEAKLKENKKSKI